MKKCLALLMGRDSRLLDHIAPLSYVMDMPLLITEERNYELAQKYYPMVKTLYEDFSELSYKKIAERYDTLFQSTFWDRNLINFFAKIHSKEMRFIYCPHGNSDKGYREKVLEEIVEQDLVLLYGDHMIDRLKKQDLWEKLPPFAITGNYRISFYQEFQSQYDAFIKEDVFSKLPEENKTILYAPTWNDREKLTSYFDLVDVLTSSLPNHYNLIIKAHPLLQERDPGRYWASMPKMDQKNICFLEDFPLIYPILSKADIYLGDFSSIGYDFLRFEKPMFFFNTAQNEHPQSLFLHCSGKTIPKKRYNDVYDFIDENLPEMEKYREKQREIYTYSFGGEKSFSEIKKSILNAL